MWLTRSRWGLGSEAILPLRLRGGEELGALEQLGVKSEECRVGSGEVLIILVF
jgi:hypothetical protein